MSPYLYRRRRRDWRPALSLAALSLGMMGLFALVPRQGAQTTPQPAPPRVGDILHTKADSALVRGTLALPGGDVLAHVAFVRGRHLGRAMYRISGCPAAGELVDVHSGIQRAWDRRDAGIFDLVAKAACGEPGRATPAAGALAAVLVRA